MSGVLMTCLERVRTGWLPQRHRRQTDSSLPSCLCSLEDPRIQKINKRVWSRGGLQKEGPEKWYWGHPCLATQELAARWRRGLH